MSNHHKKITELCKQLAEIRGQMDGMGVIGISMNFGCDAVHVEGHLPEMQNRKIIDEQYEKTSFVSHGIEVFSLIERDGK